MFRSNLKICALLVCLGTLHPQKTLAVDEVFGHFVAVGPAVWGNPSYGAHLKFNRWEVGAQFGGFNFVGVGYHLPFKIDSFLVPSVVMGGGYPGVLYAGPSLKILNFRGFGVRIDNFAYWFPFPSQGLPVFLNFNFGIYIDV